MTITSGYKALASDVLHTLNTSGYLQLDDLTAATISGGIITVVKNWYSVDTEGSAASDDLDTITAGSGVADGHILVLRAANDARTVVVKHGTGNIKTFGGGDIYLDDAADAVVCVYDSANSKWLVLSGGIAVDNSSLQIASGTVSIKALGVGTAHIAANAVTTAKLATDSVDDTIAGNRVLRMIGRRGGNAFAWDVDGTSNYTPGMTIAQSGVTAFSFADGVATGSEAITFPTAFSQRPMVIMAIEPTSGFWSAGVSAYITRSSTSSSGFTMNITVSSSTGLRQCYVSWLALGTE